MQLIYIIILINEHNFTLNALENRLDSTGLFT